MKFRAYFTFVTVAFVLAAQPIAAQTNAVTIDALFVDWNDEHTNFDSNDGVNPICDDHPGQGDVKGAGIASNHNTVSPATTVYLRFDFDETGAPGANTFDGCWLLDANINGNVEQALCFTLQGNPALLTDTRYFTCNDSTPDTCAGNVAVALPASAACAAGSVTGLEILNDCTGDDPSDTEDRGVECEIALADLPIASIGSAVALLQACSYNSQQPNSNGVDCVIDAGNPWTINIDTGVNTTPSAPVELQAFSVE